jgi:acyl-CoA thioester hydrolase
MIREHHISFRVRYPECDPMGVVHHSVFFHYFEMGRVELLRANGVSYAQLEQQGVLFVVVKVECKYKAPARYDDELTLLTKVARQTPVRIDHEYILRRGDTVLAEAKTTIACVDRAGVIQEIPAQLGGE